MLKERAFQVAVWVGVVVMAASIAAYAVFVGGETPGVKAVSPSGDSLGVAITSPIRVEFGTAMERGSVEGRLEVEPAVEGTTRWDSNDLLFVPEPALAVSTFYTVTLDAGAVDLNGELLDEETSWSFQTRAPELLFLARTEPGAESRQLHATFGDNGRTRLTKAPHGVWDFGVHPLGEEIVYSELRADGGADLMRMDRNGLQQRMLLGCPGSSCVNPVWSPDGGTIAYERRGIWADSVNLDPKAGRIWLLDLESGDDRPLFEYDVAAHSPAWSPDGLRLAYVSPLLPGIEVVNLESRQIAQYANEWGSAPEWSPDGASLVVPELVLAGESLLVRLLRIDLDAGTMEDISGDPMAVKDVSPSWSPGGGWIAYSRQFLGNDSWTPGRAIWLTRPDASGAYPLVSEAQSDLFASTWRPDAGALAYLGSDVSKGPQALPSVSLWVFDFVRRRPAAIAADAVAPAWLP